MALAGLLALTLTGCGPKHSDIVSEVAKAMQSGLATDFAKIDFEEPTGSIVGEPAPALVYQGKNSTLLVATKPSEQHSMFLATMLMRGLARTKNGHYFELGYRSALEAQDSLPFRAVVCTAPECRRIEGARSLTVKEAKRWFFDSDEFTPERYRELFGEDAPPKRVQA